MTASVRLTEIAESDLIEIWQFIAEDSISKADSLLATLENKSSDPCPNPEIGRLRPELAGDLRSFPVGSYVLFILAVMRG